MARPCNDYWYGVAIALSVAVVFVYFNSPGWRKEIREQVVSEVQRQLVSMETARQQIVALNSVNNPPVAGNNPQAAAAQSRRPSGLHPDVNVVPSTPSQPLPHHDCVPLPESPRPGVKICIYPSDKDKWISKRLKAGTLFEKPYVTLMSRLLKSDPELQLVDLGANIGVYSIYAAAGGSRVLSVDLLPDNIRQIQHSLHESGMEDLVTLVNNGLYFDHRELTANFIDDNVGATHLNVSKINFKAWGMPENKEKSITVKTICMDDLIPLLKSRKVVMKMDIERTEAKALRCALNFFKEVDVRVLLMEWMAKSREEIVEINAFMSQHGFKASSNPFSLVPVNTNVETVPGSNVFWLKMT